eukprot:m.166606 g.166606  ORF g.166606 m.166606 type:complete len:60 (+) comp14444_c0_seq3:1233-1412(+)
MGVPHASFIWIYKGCHLLACGGVLIALFVTLNMHGRTGHYWRSCQPTVHGTMYRYELPS